MSHLTGIVSTFSGTADPSLGYSGAFASGMHGGLCGCDSSIPGDYNFYIEPYYKSGLAARFYMPWGAPTKIYYYDVYGTPLTTTSSVSTFENYNFHYQEKFNGLPVPNIGSNYTISGSGLVPWNNAQDTPQWYSGRFDFLMARTGKEYIHLPEFLEETFRYFRTFFTGIEDPLIDRDPPYVPFPRPYIPYLPHSLNGQINACPQSCLEIPYFAAINHKGHFGMDFSDTGVDLFPPLKTGSPSAEVDFVNPTFPSGLIFYSYGTGHDGKKRYFSPNYFLASLSGAFVSGVENPIVFLKDDPGDSLYPNERFSCKEPLILQHPIDTYTKIGGKAHYRAFALDWDGEESEELKYQWFRTLKTSYSPVPIPPVTINGLSNGATTPDLTVMEIDLNASISGVIFTNYGKYYTTPPVVTLAGAGATVGTALTGLEGVVTEVEFSSEQKVDWTMETSQAVGRSPSISFSASPSGAAYTASGLLIPNAGFNKSAICASLVVNKSGIIRGVVEDYDDEFYYFCKISNDYISRDTQMASLTIETSLQFPLITSNRSYFAVSSFKVVFKGGNVTLEVDGPGGIGSYAGIRMTCDAHKDVMSIGHQVDTTECEDKPISTGLVWAEQAGVSLGSKDGDCWEGVNYSLYCAENESHPHGLHVKSGSSSWHKIDYGNFIQSTPKNLTQSHGDLLYGMKALPICENFALIHSGVTVDVILTHGNGNTQKHMEQGACPGFLNEYTTGLYNGAYCSLRHPNCYAGAYEVYHYANGPSASLSTLGCIGAFTSGEDVFCPGVQNPPSKCDHCSTTKSGLWALFDEAMIAGTGCGFRNPVLRRKHYISVGQKDVEDNGSRYFACEVAPGCAGLYQREGTYLKDAGIQYNWLTYPRDARLRRVTIPDSLYGFKWEYDIHGRDKYNNGPPSNFLSSDFKTNTTLYDHISNFGLYSTGLPPLLPPRPLYEFGYDKNTCSGCVVVDPCADKSNEQTSYLTPILEVVGNPYRRAGHTKLEGGWQAPNLPCSYFSFQGKLELQNRTYVCCDNIGSDPATFFRQLYYESKVLYPIDLCGSYDQASGSVEYVIALDNGANPPYISIKKDGVGTGLCELGQVTKLDGSWNIEWYRWTGAYQLLDSASHNGEPCSFAFDLLHETITDLNCSIGGGGTSTMETQYILSAAGQQGDVVFENVYPAFPGLYSHSCNSDLIYTGSGTPLNYTGERSDSHCKSYILKDITSDCYTDSCYPMKPIYVGSCIYGLTLSPLSSGQGVDMVSGILKSRYGYDLTTGNAKGNYLVVTSELDASSAANKFTGEWHKSPEEKDIYLPTLDKQAFLGFGEVDNLGTQKKVITRENYTGVPVTGWTYGGGNVVLCDGRTYETIKFDITYAACLCFSMFSGYTISTIVGTTPTNWYDSGRRINEAPHQTNAASYKTYPTGDPNDDAVFETYLLSL